MYIHVYSAEMFVSCCSMYVYIDVSVLVQFSLQYAYFLFFFLVVKCEDAFFLLWEGYYTIPMSGIERENTL